MSVVTRYKAGAGSAITWTVDLETVATGASNTMKMVGVGPYAFLDANPPPIGQQGQFPTGYFVESYTLRRTEGTFGRLEVLGTKMTINVITIETDVEQELDWIRLDRPLIMHPIWEYDGNTWFIQYPLSLADRNAINFWEQEPNAEDRETYKYRSDPDSAAANTLSFFAERYAVKRLRGMDSYIEYVPVVRRRSSVNKYDAATVNTSGLACIWSAASVTNAWGAAVPAGWMWLKTADRWSRTGRRGKWRRNCEWTGMPQWDAELYRPFP